MKEERDELRSRLSAKEKELGAYENIDKELKETMSILSWSIQGGNIDTLIEESNNISKLTEEKVSALRKECSDLKSEITKLDEGGQNETDAQ